MPARPVIGLSPLQRIAISPDELASRLDASKTTLQDLIIENGNREYIASRGTYNLTGYVLFLFEYLGRRGTINEIIAASEDPKLTDRSVLTGLRKVNEILYQVLGLKIQHIKESGELRMVNQNDAITATEAFATRLTKVRDEYVRTMDAYRATGGDVAGILAASEGGQKLAELGRVLSPAAEAVAA